MNIKIKDIARKGISLVLAVSMMVPTGVYAGNHTVNSWDSYKEKLKSDIMKQNEGITINFIEGIRFSSEGLAQEAMNKADIEAKNEIPNYFNFNIINLFRSPKIEKKSDDSYLLINVAYHVKYYNNFVRINELLSELYVDINTDQTYFEKIERAYYYIIEKLEYEANSSNHNIESSLSVDKGVSANAYAMLFSIIMDKIGYENRIVTGKIKGTTDHAWNVVKVQGKWYHVDTKLGDVNYFKDDRENFLLTSYAKMRVNYNHVIDGGYTDEYTINEDAYDVSKFIENELTFIKNSMVNTNKELSLLRGDLGIESETEGMKNVIGDIETYQKLTETKNNFYGIKDKLKFVDEKINGYENSIDVLFAMVVDVDALRIARDDLRIALDDLKLNANIAEKLNEIEQAILAKEKQILAKKAIGLVKIAQEKVQIKPDENKILPEGLLLSWIDILKVDVKLAEVEVKTVKDATIKAELEDILDDINLIISALNAVDQAERATIPTSSNVSKARNAIAKIINDDYTAIKSELNNRIGIVDYKIKSTIAENLIKKAESSLLRADYNKAKLEVDKLNISEGKGLELINRVVDANYVITAKEAVVNAEAIMKANKEVERYKDVVGLAVNKFDDTIVNYVDKDDIGKQQYDVKYGAFITSLDNRINAMKTAIAAIDNVVEVELAYTLGSSGDVSLLMAIEEANDSIVAIDPNNLNLINIKKSLVYRLKAITDKINADGKFNIIIRDLKIIEENIISKLVSNAETIYQEINDFEDKVASIELLSTDVKDVRKRNEINLRITAIKDVLAAAKAVEIAEDSDEITVSKKIIAASKAIIKLGNTSINYRIIEVSSFKTHLEDRINTLNYNVETKIKESKARAAVDKAKISEKEIDIKAAIVAVSKLENGTTTKIELTGSIESLIGKLINYAFRAIDIAIMSIKNNDKSVTNNVSNLKRAVSLVNNVILSMTEGDIRIIDDGVVRGYIREYNLIADLNDNIIRIDLSVAALNAVQQAVKYKNQANVDVAKLLIDKIISKEGDSYYAMKSELISRINAVEEYLAQIDANDEAARVAVADAEKPMIKPDTVPADKVLEITDFIYKTEKVLAAKAAVKNVFDKNIKKELELRITNLEIAQAAIVSFNKATVYPIENNIKGVEAALGKIGSDYYSLIEVLNSEIAELYKNLNKTKSEAFVVSDRAINYAKEVIIKLNLYMAGLIGADNLEVVDRTIIVDGVETVDLTERTDASNNKFDKDIAYGRIRVARNSLMDAEDAVQMLSNSTDIKSLTNRIKLANENIDKADDKIDVEVAKILVNIASTSVNKAKIEKTDANKVIADFDITAAKLAIAIINHNDNKEIKSTITKNLSLIEKRLTSNNDKELIDAAYVLVNDAANLLAEAIADDDVNNQSSDINDAIWAANLAIVGISDANKEAKSALKGFLDEITEIFALEQDTFDNEDRIINAREAVAAAENYKGEDEDKKYSLIRSARLRVSIIKNLNSDTKVIIDELNLKLDILEGKTGGGSGTGGGNSGGNSGGSGSGNNKPGGDTTPINIVPTTPLPDSKRVIGTTEPIWGKTKELKKANPTTSPPVQDMTLYKVNESKLKTIELSNVLKATSSSNAILVVRGKNIKLDSKPYINDVVNNSILLPVKFLGDELGFAVSLIDSPVANGSKRLIINGLVNGASKSIILDIGSEYGYVNGSLVKISSKPVIQEGRTYIPVDFMVEHLGITFSYYNTSGYIQLIVN